MNQKKIDLFFFFLQTLLNILLPPLCGHLFTMHHPEVQEIPVRWLKCVSLLLVLDIQLFLLLCARC